MTIIDQVKAAKAKNPKVPLRNIFKDLKITPSKYYNALKSNKTQLAKRKKSNGNQNSGLQDFNLNVNPHPTNKDEISMQIQGSPAQIAEVLKRLRH
jgi:hypothetical protein